MSIFLRSAEEKKGQGSKNFDESVTEALKFFEQQMLALEKQVPAKRSSASCCR